MIKSKISLLIALSAAFFSSMQNSPWAPSGVLRSERSSHNGITTPAASSLSGGYNQVNQLPYPPGFEPTISANRSLPKASQAWGQPQAPGRIYKPGGGHAKHLNDPSNKGSYDRFGTWFPQKPTESHTSSSAANNRTTVNLPQLQISAPAESGDVYPNLRGRSIGELIHIPWSSDPNEQRQGVIKVMYQPKRVKSVSVVVVGKERKTALMKIENERHREMEQFELGLIKKCNILPNSSEELAKRIALIESLIEQGIIKKEEMQERNGKLYFEAITQREEVKSIETGLKDGKLHCSKERNREGYMEIEYYKGACVRTGFYEKGIVYEVKYLTGEGTKEKQQEAKQIEKDRKQKEILKNLIER